MHGDRAIDQVCDDFEAQWRSGKRPRVEDFLEGWEEPGRSRLLGLLLAVELEWRRDRLGEHPAEEEYGQRFSGQETILAGFFGPGRVPIVLSAGARLGLYEIIGPLGEGGMGQVYRARDTRLGREVAIKVLKPPFADDPAWVARFEREARLLALMKHPHIATLYNLEEADGVRFLVMELVAGPTLAVRLEKGRLSLVQTLSICRQIAEAVEYAHGRGVIHRDLKPANVKVSGDGEVKVLDFGLAKAVSAVVSGDSARDTSEYNPQTGPNTIVGTLAYMSPEQANGEKPTDPRDEWEFGKRCDVWAFGCILFECLSGKPTFSGKSSSEVLAAVLRDSPDWQALPKVPPRIDALIRRCLQRDSQRRQRDLGDARLEIEETLEELKNPPAKSASPSRRLPLPYAAALVALVAALCFSLGWWVRPGDAESAPTPKPPPPEESHWVGQELLDGFTSVISPRISPDFRKLAFAVQQEGQTQVGVMNLETGDWFVQTEQKTRGMINTLSWSRTRIYFDRFFDRPNGIYTAAPPDVKLPQKEPAFIPGAECPEVTHEGTVFFCRPDGKGRSRFFTRPPGQRDDSKDLSVFGPAVELTPGWPPPSVRALHNSQEVIFCGKVFDKDTPSPQRFLYRLNLTTKQHRKVHGAPLQTSVPIAVSPDDRYLYTVLPEEDMFRVVRLPLSGEDDAKTETIWTLSNPVLGLEVDRECIYLVPYPRPRELLRLPIEGGRPERLGNVLRDNDVQPVQLPDGRFVRPGRVLGRDRLSLALPGRYPVPLLPAEDPGQTRPPIALVPGGPHSPDLLAFVHEGPDRKVRLRLATFDREPQIVQDVPGMQDRPLTALAASPDGRELYYVHNRELHRVPVKGGPHRRLAPDQAVDAVAVHPQGKKLLVQRFSDQGVKLTWAPLDGGKPSDIEVVAGPGSIKMKLVPSALSSGAIDKRDRVLVTVATPDSWFWRPALLTLDADSRRGKLELIPREFEGDFWLPTWSRDGKQILAVGHPFRTELWRLKRRKGRE
jgi:serine/threonine protein kinase